MNRYWWLNAIDGVRLELDLIARRTPCGHVGPLGKPCDRPTRHEGHHAARRTFSPWRRWARIRRARREWWPKVIR